LYWRAWRSFSGRAMHGWRNRAFGGEISRLSEPARGFGKPGPRAEFCGRKESPKGKPSAGQGSNQGNGPIETRRAGPRTALAIFSADEARVRIPYAISRRRLAGPDRMAEVPGFGPSLAYGPKGTLRGGALRRSMETEGARVPLQGRRGPVGQTFNTIPGWPPRRWT